MTSNSLLASLAAGALAAPLLGPVPAAAQDELAIREIVVRPAEPVVGASGSVRLVIDVVATGVGGQDGVTVKVEPGSPPRSGPEGQPESGQPPAATPSGAVISAAPSDAVAGTGARVVAVARPSEEAPAVVASSDTSVRAPFTGVSAVGDMAGGFAPAVPGPSGGDPGAQALAGAQEALNAPQKALTGEEGVFVPVRHPESCTEALAAPDRGPAARTVSARPGISAGHAGARRVAAGWTGTAVGPQDDDGAETWRFLPEKGLNRYYPSGVWTIAATAKAADGRTVTAYESFKLRRETRLTSVTALKVPGERAVKLRGVLTRVDPEGYTDYSPYGNQRMEIHYRRDADDVWQLMAAATTTTTGAFTRTVEGRVRGQWRASFPGTTHYATKYSQIRQIG
ncbi:hypothetical protein [Nonomuraea longicatena]|uniref:Secreted protein n=1 Tax=Nonomuraea longicatena TaxID=83682 RepID=A0ABN1NZE1_9ACTN